MTFLNSFTPAFVKKDGLYFQYVSEELRADRKIALVTIKGSASTYDYVDDEEFNRELIYREK